MVNGDISEDVHLQHCENNPQSSSEADPFSSFSCTLLELDENKGLTPHLRQKLPKRRRKKATDFVFLRILGEGAYSTVYLARDLHGGQAQAIKVVQKDFVYRHQKLEAIVREKDILAALSYEHGGHPFVTRLYSTFDDHERLFFVTDVAHLGDLLGALNRLGSFDVPMSRFYAAEIVVALEFIHKCGVVHRDVKPENVLIRRNGHIMLTDFGSARIYDQKLFRAYEDENESPTEVQGQARQHRHYLDIAASSSSSSSLESDEHHVGGPERRATFVGTAQYVSPEMLRGDQVGPPCDYWAVGAIVFQMISGQAPFRAVNDFHLMNKIQKLDFSFPAEFPDVPKDFVSQLLVLDPMVRLGSGNWMDLKSHEFFSGIDWENIMNMEPPGIFPSVPPGLEEAELKSLEEMPEPGLDEKALKRLMNLSLTEMVLSEQLSLDSDIPSDMVEPPKVDKEALAARQRKLEKQRQENPYHMFVQDNLIIRSGLLDKKRVYSPGDGCSCLLKALIFSMLIRTVWN